MSRACCRVSSDLQKLLSARRAQTVAHGATGNPAQARAIGDEHWPTLDRLLDAFGPLFELTLAQVRSSSDQHTDAVELTRFHNGLWRSITLQELVLNPG